MAIQQPDQLVNGFAVDRRIVAILLLPDRERGHGVDGLPARELPGATRLVLRRLGSRLRRDSA